MLLQYHHIPHLHHLNLNHLDKSTTREEYLKNQHQFHPMVQWDEPIQKINTTILKNTRTKIHQHRLKLEKPKVRRYITIACCDIVDSGNNIL
jgi:hypothetical protein